MQKRRVFIGIRTYNREQLLDEAFNSVYEQDCSDMVVVAYDDKSTDGTIGKLAKWKEKLADRGVEMQVYQNNENGGCGQAFERMGRIVASQMNDDDIFVMLDSDDKFTSNKAISKIAEQMDKTGANICISGFNLTGDLNLVLNWDSGTPHNNLSHKLAEKGVANVEQMPEIASHADSIGWTKITKGNIFKRYMSMFPAVSKEQRVCEDFPSLAMLLFKDAKITGLSENMYDYHKHAQSSVSRAVPSDFRVVRLGYLQALQNIVANNEREFIDGADKYVNKFLEVKYRVIGNIVNKKNKALDLEGYGLGDWVKDFHDKIDCSNLKLHDFGPELDKDKTTMKKNVAAANVHVSKTR